MAFIEYSDIIEWEEYVEKFKVHENSSDLIFRGQSNAIKKINPLTKKGKVIDKELDTWKLISSFNRYYNATNHYDFSTIISQQLENDLFRFHYEDYQLLREVPLHEMDLLNKLYLLQHYGCPTCLIDFTTDPLIALYFAITSVKGSSGYSLDNEYNISNYPNDCYLTIYQIDCRVLREIGIKEVPVENSDLFLSYNDYNIHLSNYRSSVVGLLNNPRFHALNYNLKQQKGCFILYDNKGCKNMGLDEFLQEYVNHNSLSNKVGINLYRINYNSIYKNRRKNKESLFSFLKNKKISGATLFNDFQGLKYDFNFFHQ